jgi:hypothetical protein
MEPKISNLTTLFQSKLGVQQAQSIPSSLLTSDVMAVLHEKRGSFGKTGAEFPLTKMWINPEEAIDFDSGHFDLETKKAAIGAFRAILDSMVVSRSKSSKKIPESRPRSFKCFAPEFVTDHEANQLFRDVGQTAVAGLWGGKETDLAQKIKKITDDWAEHHIAKLFTPLLTSTAVKSVPASTVALFNLRNNPEHHLNKQGWFKIIEEDWTAWADEARYYSIDEQMETFQVLLGLHLHLTMLRIISPSGTTPAFLCVANDSRQLSRASRVMYVLWYKRLESVFREVAAEEVERLSAESNDLRDDLEFSTTLVRWKAVPHEEREYGKRQGEDRLPRQRFFKQQIERRMTALGDQFGAGIEKAAKKRVLVESLYEAYNHSRQSAPTMKAQTLMRDLGRAASLFPDDARRKQYLIDESLLALLAGLSLKRASEVGRKELSTLEFYEEIAQRYGILVSNETALMNKVVLNAPDFIRNSGAFTNLSSRELASNREEADRMLESRGMIRRYSDSSTVVRRAVA